MTKDEWIRVIGSVPDGDADEGPAFPVEWSRDEDPDLYDAAQEYYEALTEFEGAADKLSGFLMRRGWGAR